MPKQNPTLETIRILGFPKATFPEGEWKHTVLHRQMKTVAMHDGSCVYLISRRATRRITAHFVDCYHAATGVQLATYHEVDQRSAMEKALAEIRQWQNSPETYQGVVDHAVGNYTNRYRLHGSKADLPPQFIQYLDRQASPELAL